jgi:hypothetical protein
VRIVPGLAPTERQHQGAVITDNVGQGVCVNRILKSTVVFAGVGLLGPLVRFATWPPSRFDSLVPKSISNFLNDFVVLLWPTQPMAVVEVNIGKVAAAALAIGANLLLFAALGATVGTFGRTRTRLIGGYVVVCGLVFYFDLWEAGFSFAYLNLFALAVALLLYAVPFRVVMRDSAMPKSA